MLILILIPILAPAAASDGIHLVQFGVMVVLNLIIGTQSRRRWAWCCS